MKQSQEYSRIKKMHLKFDATILEALILFEGLTWDMVELAKNMRIKWAKRAHARHYKQIDDITKQNHGNSEAD